MAKTYLEKLIATYDSEQQKLWESAKDNNSEVENLNLEIEELEDTIKELRKELKEYEDVSYETIDFGIGKLEYIQSDNLRIRNFMDSLKERFHGHTLD